MEDAADTADKLRTMPSRLLNFAAHKANGITDRALAEVGARRYHYALLATLHEFGAMSQAELGRRTGIDRSDVTATVRELSDQGHLDQAPDRHDRRRNVVDLTARGRLQFERLDQLLDAANAQLLAGLSRNERERLIDLLSKIVG